LAPRRKLTTIDSCGVELVPAKFAGGNSGWKSASMRGPSPSSFGSVVKLALIVKDVLIVYRG
jgi:hypothetical protein